MPEAATKAAIQGTHLKRWTLRSGVTADVRDRGVPWVRLLLADAARGRRASTLNIRPAERLYTALTVAAVLALTLAAASGRTAWLAAAAACLIVVLGGNAGLLRWLARVRARGACRLVRATPRSAACGRPPRRTSTCARAPTDRRRCACVRSLESGPDTQNSTAPRSDPESPPESRAAR